MKTLRILVASGLAITSFAALAYSPGAGITGTPHDWSAATGGTTPSGQPTGTALLLWLDSKGNQTTYNTGTPYAVAGVQQKTYVQIGQCTKCHTPHQAKSINLLWNHTLQGTVYKWDETSTTAGTTYPTFKGDTYRGPTTKCLSCHDGLMASTDGMWFNRAMTASSKYTAPTGSLDTGHEVAKGAAMNGSHPVAMPYPLGGVPNTYNGVMTGTIEPTEWVADPSKTNGIRLFNDLGVGDVVAGTNQGKTGMECTSCHDVHNGARVKDVILLTGKINGSDRSPGGYICTQCHLK